MDSHARRQQGRPHATDHGAIERAAFRLFAEQGFEATTVDDIAAAAGIGRRTLFRYYPSKNDIPWGQFDESLMHLADFLEAMPRDVPVYQAVHRAVLDFNRVPPEAIPQHRQRMRLLLNTPALQAHAALRHTEWRQVIATFVARRCDVPADSLLPKTVGRVSLALALSAYEQWLEERATPLEEILDGALAALRRFYR